MKRVWSIRQYREGDEYQINKMRAIVGGWGKGGSIDLNYWRWKFKRAPAGSSIILVAANKNRIIGHYAIIPIKMKIFGESMLGSQAEDAMTDPGYKRQGIMNELFKRALMIAGERGITVTYGFPNEQSGPGHLKAGWRLICEVPKLIKIMNVKKVSGYINNKILQLPVSLGLRAYDLFKDFASSFSEDKVNIIKASAFDQRFNDLWENSCRNYDFIIERKMEYLNWRYAQDPLFKNTIYTAEKGRRLAGYIILREGVSSKYKGAKIGFISDLMCEPGSEKVLSSLVSKAIIHFREKNVDVIRCQMMKGNQYYRALTMHGFFRFGKEMFIMHINSPESKVNLEKIINDKRIFITYGDGF